MTIKATAKELVEGRRNLDILRVIPRMHQHAKMRIAGKTTSVDAQTANVLVMVHDALNDKNQISFQSMLSISPSTFRRAVDFSWSRIA